VAEVPTVEMEQIKRIEDDVVGFPLHGRAKRLEVGDTLAILHDGLTIDNCRLAAKVGGGADDRGITVAPIISVTGEDTCFAALNQHLAAVAIVFDFVNPVFPLWRLFDRGSKLWLDEPEPCRKH
jgi:hypothetical protein